MAWLYGPQVGRQLFAVMRSVSVQRKACMQEREREREKERKREREREQYIALPIVQSYRANPERSKDRFPDVMSSCGLKTHTHTQKSPHTHTHTRKGKTDFRCCRVR